MKSKISYSMLFLSGCLLAGTVSSYAQPTKEKGLKKGPNLAVNLTNRKTVPERTYLNLGFISNFQELDGLGINVISSITHFRSNGVQIAGITNVTGLNTKGGHLSGIANVTGGNSSGILASGLMNVNGKGFKGVSFSGIGNFTGDNSSGWVLGGLMNISGNRFSGVQLAGLANITAGLQKGIHLAGLMNVTGDSLKGLQLSSILNVTAEASKGVQLAGIGNVAVINKGVQLGAANYAQENRGLQLGVANIDSIGHKGVQIGLVNVSKDSTAHQFGCINLNPSTRIQMVVSGGNFNCMSVAARFKRRHTYTELGAGTRYPAVTQSVPVNLFYRAGIYHPLSSRIIIGADAGFFHIENVSSETARRMYAFQPRINLEYRIGPKMGISIAGGYNWQRYYGHSFTAEKDFTFDLSLIFF